MQFTINIKVHVREDLNLDGLIVAYEIDISDCSVQLVTDIKSSRKRQKLKMEAFVTRTQRSKVRVVWID